MRTRIFLSSSLNPVHRRAGVRTERPDLRHRKGPVRRSPAGATITAKNLDTGLCPQRVTDAERRVRVPALPPGTLLADRRDAGLHQGDASRTSSLIIDQDAVINFTLKPAHVAEALTVTGEAPIVDTTKSDVSTSVSTQQIQDLPVASRRWIDLAMLTPARRRTTSAASSTAATSTSAAGAREYSNGFIVGRREQHVGRDGRAAAELRDGRDPGVQGLDLELQGGVRAGHRRPADRRDEVGTNQMHGSGLLFFRNAALTAEEYPQKILDKQQNVAEGTNEPDYHRYQYGGTIGGPIILNQDALLLRL
jgi:hypothetical protein